MNLRLRNCRASKLKFKIDCRKLGYKFLYVEKSIKIGSKETQDMKISFEAEHAESMFMLEGAEQPMVMSTPSSWSVITLYVAFLVVGVVLGYIIYLTLQLKNIDQSFQ